MNKVLDGIDQALKVLCMSIMGIIVAVLFYAVIMRYLLHRPPSWSMELARYLFLWMVMFSAVLVTRERTHIQITFFVGFLPETFRFVWMNIIRVWMLWFCWIMIHQGMVILPTVAEASSPSLEISMGWLYLSVPAGGLLMGIYILENMVRSVIERVHRTQAEGGA